MGTSIEHSRRLPMATAALANVPERGPSAALGVNLRYLHVLCAVVDAGSVAQAADGLSRVSSAVARSISELEAELAVPLFARHSRGMVPNANGEIVLVRARRIERQFDEARQQLIARGGVRAQSCVQALFASIPNGRRLAVIANLVDRRSMAAVARELSITQPTISAAVKDLETRLGVALFERSARGLVPTVAAEILALHFKRVLAELRHIASDLAASEGTLQGSIHVGALPLGRTDVLPRAIASLLTRHPQLHVATVESPYEALAASLRSGEIDFILGALRGPACAKELEQEPLFEDQLSVVARAGHPLTRARRIDFDMLRRATWVLSRARSPARELFETFFSEARQPPPVPSVETGDLAVLRGLLLETDILTAISAQQLRYEICDGSLVVLDFPLERTRRQIGISQRLGAFPSPGAKALMEEIRQVVKQSPDFPSR
jgi:LysR family transcriptional regulator of gallate degradation